MTFYSSDDQFENYRFYLRNYRGIQALNLMLSVLAIIMFLILGFLVSKPKPIDYYATSVDGRIKQMQSLDVPIVSDTYVVQWSTNILRQLYTINFATVNVSYTRLAPYFTEDGWNAFLTSIIKGKVIKNIQDSQLIVTAVINGPPVIIGKGVMDFRYTWILQAPIMITYSGASGAASDVKVKRIATIRVQRVPTLSAVEGIQIVSISLASSK